SQAAHSPTWAGRPASSPATAGSEITVSKITAVPGKSTIVVQGTPSPLTLSLPATSESYVVYVLVQPKSAVAVSSVASQPQ
ncbi:MAG TPA: hypothetical protein V6C57_10760, partial [Coleofasciculaceae cyanobacterium]